MRRHSVAVGILLAAAGLGCSDDGGSDTGSGGQAGSASGAAGAPSGGSGNGGSSMGGGGATFGGSAGATFGGSAGVAGSAGSGGAAQIGVCGQRGKATVSTTAFDGEEEFYIIGDRGFGEDICVVRFDVARAGDAPAGCVDEEGKACAWTHLVRYSNPEVVLDTDGVCANSEYALTQARIDEIDGSEVAYGFVDEYAGHASVPLKRQPTGEWIPFGLGNWDPDTSMFRFDYRDGNCSY